MREALPRPRQDFFASAKDLLFINIFEVNDAQKEGLREPGFSPFWVLSHVASLCNFG